MSQFKTIEDVWAAVDKGETVYWSNTAYKVYVEPDNSPETTKIYAPRKYVERNGKLLSIRCIENYFGGIIGRDELSKLFTAARNGEQGE